MGGGLSEMVGRGVSSAWGLSVYPRNLAHRSSVSLTDRLLIIPATHLPARQSFRASAHRTIRSFSVQTPVRLSFRPLASPSSRLSVCLYTRILNLSKRFSIHTSGSLSVRQRWVAVDETSGHIVCSFFVLMFYAINRCC